MNEPDVELLEKCELYGKGRNVESAKQAATLLTKVWKSSKSQRNCSLSVTGLLLNN